jgi:two-component system sporulation sensor kinase A
MFFRSLSRAELLFISLLLVAGTAVPLAWLLDQDTRQELALGVQEEQALHLIEMARQELRSAGEDFLSGEALSPVDATQMLQKAQAQVTEAKQAGHQSHLILDPQLNIYHLSYLSTVKLPERVSQAVELAYWERKSKGLGPRALFLRQSLEENWQEETRALDLALEDDPSPAARLLRDQDRERRERLDAYNSGQPLRLRELIRDDLRFWELCDQRLDQALVLRQDRLRSSRHLRLGLGLALLLLLEAAGWLLQRRLMRQEVASAHALGAENYKLLYQSIPVAAFVYDLRGYRITNANPAAAKLLGSSVEGLVGMSLPDFVPAPLRANFLSELKTRGPSAEFHGEQRIQSLDGRLLDVEVQARAIQLDGRALRLVMLTDITAARAAQEALRKNEERFRALTEDSSEALILMSPEGKVLYASQSSESVSGYPPEERVGSHSNAVLHPDDRAQVWKVFQQALADPSRTYAFESRFHHKKGHYIRTAAKLRNRLADPAIGALVLNYRDVSAEYQAQQDLQASETRFRALIENTPDIVLIYRGDGSVDYQNPASALAILGYTQAELGAFGAFDLVHPDDLAAARRSAELSLSQPRLQTQMEIRLHAKDGTWKSFDARSINLSDSPVVGGILVQLRDISASREAQRQLLRLERMAAIGQTTAGLAHEVRNPLAIISARAEFLRDQLGAKPGMQEDLDSILRQVERLRDLVNQVLERARSEDLLLKDVDAAELLESALRAAQIRYGSAAEQVSVGRDLAKPAPQLRVDVPQIERVLLNLILNALQAMGPGGALTLSARPEGDWALLSVADNGPGIPEAKLAKIFEPFYTTKQTGSGLGLWICKSIVEQHGGSLEVENLKPQGCRFTLRLPVIAQAAL